MPDQNNLSNHDYVKAYMRSLQAQFREAKSAEDITKIKEAIIPSPICLFFISGDDAPATRKVIDRLRLRPTPGPINSNFSTLCQAIQICNHLNNLTGKKMTQEYDSGYESNGEGFDIRDVLAGDHDDVPLDILVGNIQ